MKLESKKDLIARTLGVGKDRIVLNIHSLPEVKESITRQDIRDLVSSGVIKIKEVKGTKKKVTRKTRRRAGSIKKKVNKRKEEYMIFTRKFRAYIKEMKKHGVLSNEDYRKIRSEIRARNFKSKANLRERILGIGGNK